MKEQVSNTIGRSGNEVISQLGVTFNKGFWDKVADEYYKKRFYDKGILYDITDTLKNQIRNTLSGAYREGTTFTEITAELEKQIDGITKWEAERIARTESLMASTQGTMDTWRTMGVTKWDLINAANPCPVCQDIAASNPHADEEKKELEAETGFSDWLLHPNCACAWVPAVENEEEYNQLLDEATKIQAQLRQGNIERLANAI